MAEVYRPTYTYTDRKTGRKTKRKSRRWHIRYYTPDGERHRVKGYRDRKATEALATELEKRGARLAEGLVDAFEEHRKRPLAEHLQDFQRYLIAKGNTQKHARLTCNRVQAILDGCRFIRTADLSASAVVGWLADQREADRIGVQTSNYYQRDLKAFCKWMVKDRRMPDNPLAHLSGMNAKVDVRVERRNLPAEEFDAFVGAAHKGGTIRRLCGPDRAMLYTVAAYTGLRESELASLTPSSFDFDAEPPSVMVAAAYSKRRRNDTAMTRYRCDLTWQRFCRPG
jgi:integrase